MADDDLTLTTAIAQLLRDLRDVRHLPDDDPRRRAVFDRKRQLADLLEAAVAGRLSGGGGGDRTDVT